MRERRLLVASLIALALIGGACSSSSSPETSPSPSGDAFCGQVQAVRESFDTLIGTDVVADGTDTLKMRFDAFTNELEGLRSIAGPEFSSEVDAVQASVDQLKTVVDEADSAGAATTASRFVLGLGSLETSTQAMFAAMDEAC